MSHKNFNVPHGKLSLSISPSQGFTELQLVYEDYAFSLNRAELIGKTREELIREIDSTLKRTEEKRNTFIEILDSVKAENGEAAYNTIIEELKRVDPELCIICGIK